MAMQDENNAQQNDQEKGYNEQVAQIQNLQNLLCFYVFRSKIKDFWINFNKQGDFFKQTGKNFFVLFKISSLTVLYFMAKGSQLIFCRT